MLRGFSSVSLAVAALILCGCAGGGGGGGGPVTPTPVSICTTSPNALACSTGPSDLSAVAAEYAKGRFSGVGGPNYKVTVDRNGTSDVGDDRFTLAYLRGASPIYRTYRNLQSKNDGLGPVRTGAAVELNGAVADGSILTLFDITNVLNGGLDYIQLGRVSPTVENVDLSFFAIGPRTPAAMMPTTGSARFDGGTRGAYITGAGSFDTTSDMTLTADFARASVSGSTSNFKMVNASGAAVTPPHDLNFSFTALISTGVFDGEGAATGYFKGGATSPTMAGIVDGVFFGEPNKAPSEVGLAYSLIDIGGGGTLVGVGGLKRNN
jgi:hypothetical protein